MGKEVSLLSNKLPDKWVKGSYIMNTKSKVEFKVGDIVKVTNYNIKRDLFWPKDTIGDLSEIIEKTEYGCYLLDNDFIYDPSELELVTEEKASKATSNDNYQLTQAELQFLTNKLTKELETSLSIQKSLKACIDKCWKYCNEYDYSTVGYFTVLNEMKDSLCKEKKEFTKLSEIQRKLKRQQGK